MTAKRIAAAALAGLMALSCASALTSCKKDKGPVMSRRTNVYAGEELPLPEGVTYVQNMFTANESVYLIYNTEYSIVRNEMGEEMLRKAGYYWQAMNYEEVVEDTIVDEEIAVPYAASAKIAVETAVAVETEAPVVEVPETEADVDLNGDGIADKPASSDVKLPTSADEIVFGEQYSNVLLPEGWYFDYTSVQSLAQVPFAGGDPVVTEVPKNDPDAYSSAMSISPAGDLYMIMQKWSYDEETMMSTTKYTLERINITTGELVSTADLNAELANADLDPNNFYIGSLTIDNAGNLYVNADSVIIQLDENGKYVSKTELDSGWINQLLGMGDKLMVMFYSDTAQTYQIKIMENGELTSVESVTLKNLMQNYYGLYGTGENKLYYGTASGISVYDFTTDTAEEILNYINSDIDFNTVNRTIVLPDGRVLMSNTDWSSNENNTTLSIMERIPDEQLKDEIIVTVGSTTTDYQLTKAIIAYNKKNTGTRISVKSYDQYNNQENEWTGAVTQFNNDIITGNVPDIVLISSDLPSASYFKKGIFADLNQFIDDEEIGIDRSKYLANVFDACSLDGRQYSMILSFRLRTLMAKSQYVGTESGWTFEDMMKVINTMPEGMRAFFDQGRDGIISSFFSMAMSSFVDWGDGTTKFESEGFIDFIKYLSTCPEKGYWEAYYDTMGDNYVYDEEKEREMQENYELRHYRGTALFEFAYMNSFTALLEQMSNFATTEVTAIGFPTDDESSNGAMILPNIELAISAKSSAKEQAWDIIKFFMDDETLNNASWRFSTNIEIMEKSLANASENYYYYNSGDDYSWYLEAGYSEDYVNYLKSRNIPFDQAACDAVMDLVKGAKEVQRSDSALVDIIKEELSVFFAGSRSAEETARIIASRANIYIAENS
ncbi:MAG: carbohydrate ABC transporter substrate-binding protein [Clostridia bacterium]|nr:carbohydrate ABC transporter substrate-binding protein [Clostridia bacterium]